MEKVAPGIRWRVIESISGKGRPAEAELPHGIESGNLDLQRHNGPTHTVCMLITFSSFQTSMQLYSSLERRQRDTGRNLPGHDYIHLHPVARCAEDHGLNGFGSGKSGTAGRVGAIGQLGAGDGVRIGIGTIKDLGRFVGLIGGRIGFNGYLRHLYLVAG